jgi:uncharacterized protein YqeY
MAVLSINITGRDLEASDDGLMEVPWRELPGRKEVMHEYLGKDRRWPELDLNHISHDTSLENY